MDADPRGFDSGGDDHLHQRVHRKTQGRHDDAWQLPRQVHGDAAARRTDRARHTFAHATRAAFVARHALGTTLGGTLYATRKYQAPHALSTLRDRRITFFIGVPMIYEQIAREPDFATADLSALTLARVGGASATPTMLSDWRAKGVIVRQLDGITEVGGGSIVATEEEALADPNHAGAGSPSRASASCARTAARAGLTSQVMSCSKDRA